MPSEPNALARQPSKAIVGYRARLEQEADGDGQFVKILSRVF
jgi:hypothetical protein